MTRYIEPTFLMIATFTVNPLNSLTCFDLLALIRGTGYESYVALNVKIAKMTICCTCTCIYMYHNANYCENRK